MNDTTMIKIMADENMNTWKTESSVIVETIQVAKEYLDNELKKYNNWDELCTKEFFST